MEPDKKKNTADTHRIIVKTYGKNFIAIRTNWFKRFKNVILISVTKNALQLWKKTNCGKMKKVVKNNISILYRFF